jgi:hypothetical protein
MSRPRKKIKVEITPYFAAHRVTHYRAESKSPSFWVGGYAYPEQVARAFVFFAEESGLPSDVSDYEFFLTEVTCQRKRRRKFELD